MGRDPGAANERGDRYAAGVSADTLRVAVIGGGPGGLMAAEVLAVGGAAVTVYERMPSVGRKLVLAGRSGLNLTHAEPLDHLLGRYGAARHRLEPAIVAFPPAALRQWAAGLGQPTFVGSTGRIFPAAMRATPLLRAWLARLAELGVAVETRTTWLGWSDDGALRFGRADDSVTTMRPDATILALGGASWPRVGSNGAWTTILRDAGVAVSPLRPANCGFTVDWSERFRQDHAGAPLKNIRMTCLANGTSVRGEAVVTTAGIEGGAIYMLSASLRDTIDAEGTATLLIDLHPDRHVDDLTARLTRRRPGDSWSTHVRRATGLRGVAIALLRESSANARSGDSVDAAALARVIKALPITLMATTSLDRAISTAGGVAFDEIDESWMLRRHPGVYVTGEMIDWEAPTGGYLLQATFATAVAAALAVVRTGDDRRPDARPDATGIGN